MSEIKRIRKVLNWLIFNEYATNDREIAIKLGYRKSSFSQIINGKVPVSDKFIEKLISADQNINKVWITSGNGSMFKYEESLVKIEDPNVPYCKECSIKLQKIKLLEEANQLLRENIKDKQDIIDLLKGEKGKNGNARCG